MEKTHKPNAELIATYSNFSPARDLTDDEIAEPFFSRYGCETCGSKLFGQRHYCTATIGSAHTGPIEKLEICTDCFEYFFA